MTMLSDGLILSKSLFIVKFCDLAQGLRLQMEQVFLKR